MSRGNSELTKFFSTRLAQLRKERELTMKQMADLICVPLTTYADAEDGKQPRYLFFYGFARAFPNDLHWLLTGERPDTRIMEPGDNELLDAYRKFPAGGPERRAIQALAGLPIDSLKK